MRTELLYSDGGRRTYAVVLDTGEEVMACLRRVAASERLAAAQITAIGAFSDAKMLFFEWESKKYLPIPVDEQCEVAALLGDIALGADGSAAVHIHAVLGRRDGTAIAGHLDRAHVRPTLEVLITELPAHLHRQHDPETGLNLIRLR